MSGWHYPLLLVCLLYLPWRPDSVDLLGVGVVVGART